LQLEKRRTETKSETRASATY